MVATSSLDERVRAFAEAARRAACEVIEAASDAEAGALLAELSEGDGVLLTAELAEGPVAQAARDAGAAVVIAGAEAAQARAEVSPASYADAPLGVARARLAIAETGSVLLDEHGLAERLVSMLSRHLVVLVARGLVADSLESAAQWLSANAGGAGFAALVTGPSRSADIERSLTVGVQGPDRMTVMIVG